jgi:hypothetical protein
MGGVAVQLQSFLNSALGRCEWSFLHPFHFIYLHSVNPYMVCSTHRIKNLSLYKCNIVIKKKKELSYIHFISTTKTQEQCTAFPIPSHVYYTTSLS